MTAFHLFTEKISGPLAASYAIRITDGELLGEATMARYNFTPNALFRSGPVMEFNACVGENGGPYDLIDYGKGFFNGAQEIFVAVKERNGIVDLLVYPICFSFRHGIELYVKALVQTASNFNGSRQAYQKNHSIDEYWNMVVEEFKKFDDYVIDQTEIGIAGTSSPILSR